MIARNVRGKENANGKNAGDFGKRAEKNGEWSEILARGSLKEGAQLARARRMAQLAQRLGFDLANAFAGYCEGLADLLQRVLAAVF